MGGTNCEQIIQFSTNLNCKTHKNLEFQIMKYLKICNKHIFTVYEQYIFKKPYRAESQEINKHILRMWEIFSNFVQHIVRFRYESSGFFHLHLIGNKLLNQVHSKCLTRYRTDINWVVSSKCDVVRSVLIPYWNNS